MAWDAFLLLIVGLYATYKTYRWSVNRGRYIYIAYFLAAGFYSVIQSGILIESIVNGQGLTVYADIILEWGNIVVISLILSAMALLVRDSKPDFAKFPFAYTFIPLFIILSYVWVKDTLAIKQWLMGIYQGGAILVAFMIYAVYTYRKPRYKFLLLATTFFVLTYFIYWLMPVGEDRYSWIWQIALGASILAGLYGYDYSFKHEPEPSH